MWVAWRNFSLKNKVRLLVCLFLRGAFLAVLRPNGHCWYYLVQLWRTLMSEFSGPLTVLGTTTVLEGPFGIRSVCVYNVVQPCKLSLLMRNNLKKVRDRAQVAECMCSMYKALSSGSTARLGGLLCRYERLSWHFSHPKANSIHIPPNPVTRADLPLALCLSHTTVQELASENSLEFSAGEKNKR